MAQFELIKLKSSYDNVISVVDDFFEQCDPQTAIQMEEVCGLLQKGLKV